MSDITRSELACVIDEYILNEKYRSVTKRRLCDGIKYEPLAEEMDLSVRHTKKIVRDCCEIIFRHIPYPDNLK